MLFRLVKPEDIWVRPYTLATTTTGKTFHQSTKGEGNHYSKKDKITIQNVRPEKTKRIGMEEIATYAKETIIKKRSMKPFRSDVRSRNISRSPPFWASPAQIFAF